MVALITGASSGLGEQFAHRFARDGHDVILVARNEARLNALAERLRTNAVRTFVMPFDLADPKTPQRLFDAVKEKGLEVDFLVNNAGFGTNGPFLDLDLARELEMVQVNCAALLELCHRFVGPMRARGRGRVLNIASTAGFQPGPFMATYYASKAFVVSFSEALADELKGTGVTVTVSCPGATATGFAKTSGNDKSRLFQRPGVAKAEDVVHAAYEAMMQGETTVVHGLMNYLAYQSLRLAPRTVARSIAATLNKPPGS
ncbi:MAG: SDR family oxidoreductase [Myxococcaceae bacterium]|nr:SDR family oxidoreductase [Myxococcaceae bacterium]